MFVLKNMWFQTLMRQFFFNIDKIVYNFISTLYDLLISIARTSILSQADILDMAGRIYELLAVFMIFKVTFSLIMYTVNPDDFSDKTKGVGKLGTNIIISLALLVLTPYVFNLAYRVQTIILEDNSLAALIFGDETSTSEENPINTAGDTMAFVVMSPFFTPNTAISQLNNCIDLMQDDQTFNQECSGLDENYEPLENKEILKNSLYALTRKDPDDLESDESDDFEEQTLKNYVVGVEKGNLGLMFRQDMAIALTSKTSTADEEYVIDYKYVFSTVLGVVVILLLLTFCMDVALRSVKLAFLQLIAPIPIISYVDPKSGKDGMFKKWYEMCFKTYISLFVRLLALYFVVYIVSRLDVMTDIVDGTYVTNMFIKIFVVIGSLMFAKQLPKILEGLGIKLDGDGKFTLNPLKKLEEQASLGKNVTGAAAGAMTGFLGNKGLRRFSGALGGLGRGAFEGKGYKEAQKHQAEVNRKLRQARYDGKTFFGTLGERYGMATGAETGSETYERKAKEVESAHKFHQANLDYAKGLRAHVLSELREKEAHELAGDTWRKHQQKLMDAESELQAANMSGNVDRINAAKDNLNKTQNVAFESIMNSHEEDKYMVAEREKYNVRIKNNEKYAKEAGLTAYHSAMGYEDSKQIKDGSQKRVNETDMELYKYSQSSEASQHRGNKTAAEAKKIDIHFDV